MGLEVFWLRAVGNSRASRRKGKASSLGMCHEELKSVDWKPNPLGRLKGKIKAELKRKAHHLRPVVQIGHSGVTDDVIAEIRRQLLIHELIKVKWASLTKEDGNKKEQARDLAERVGAHFISLIGQVVVLYRRREGKVIL